jgi:LCP family protein required for cell wall assembly
MKHGGATQPAERQPARHDGPRGTTDASGAAATETRKGAASSLHRALLITAAAALIPGIAHIRAGRTRTGGVMIACCWPLLAAAAIVIVRHRESLLFELAVRPGALAICTTVAIIMAIVWAAVICRSYLLVRPRSLSRPRAITGTITVTIMCLVVAMPPLFVARVTYLQRDLVTSVFSAETMPAGPAAGGARGPGSGSALPRRLNILLMGGDADVGRPGVRTDSLTLASIDTATGATVLLSLPRNLQHVPVWAGRHRLKFPREELLNEVYEYGLAHSRALDPLRQDSSRAARSQRGAKVRNAGAELLKRTVGHILGLPVAYYGMVDMRSFRRLVDAMGGLRVCIAHTVPVPRLPTGALRPGCRTLTGKEALWYGRSRTGSSDFSRMSRQKCLLWAIAKQARPATVLRRFRQLAEVFKYSVNTDIPRSLLPPLIALSGKVRHAGIASIQFMPPLISTGRPDYTKIRALAQTAVHQSSRATPKARGLHMLNKTCT